MCILSSLLKSQKNIQTKIYYKNVKAHVCEFCICIYDKRLSMYHKNINILYLYFFFFAHFMFDVHFRLAININVFY